MGTLCAARRGRERDREPARRQRSPSDDFSSGSPEPRERLRATWFDVTPEMVAQGQGGRSEEQVKNMILKMAGEQMPVDKSGLQLTQATRHARRIYVGGLPPSANEDRISSFFSYALAAVGGAPLHTHPDILVQEILLFVLAESCVSFCVRIWAGCWFMSTMCVCPMVLGDPWD